MDFWSTHGLNDLEEDIQIRKLVRQVAHLQAIADINDRVIGNQNVYYDTFDGTNDHSPGKVDLSRVEGVVFSSEDETSMVFRKEGLDKFSDFKIGQEVTVHDDTSKYVATIQAISNGNGEDNNSYIRLNTKSIPAQGTYTICRSMIRIVDGKCYLHPTDILEHDIRINIDLGESKTYTFISWIEHEKDMALSNFTATNTPPQTRVRRSLVAPSIIHRPMNIKGIQIDSHIKVSWSNPKGKDYIACVFKGDSQELVFEGKNATEFIDQNPSIGQNSYKVLYRTESEIGSKASYCSVKFHDLVPPQNVSQIRVGYAYLDEETVRMDYTWTNPIDEDFKEVFFKVDGEVKYTGDNNHFSFIANTGKEYNIDIGVRDIYENEQEVSHSPGVVSPLEYWGVKIDFSNTNDPNDSVEYIGLAKGITPANSLGLGGWSSVFPFKDIKVCMLENASGQFLGYVDPNDYSRMADGTDNTWYRRPTAKTMVEIPTIYTHSYTDKDGVLYIKFSRERILDGYTALAHEDSDGVKDYLYISSYPLTSQCACVSGESPISYSYNVFKNMISKPYSMWKYSHIDLIQKLFVLAYKSLDSVNSLGKGSTGIGTNGKFDNCGLIYGDNSGEGVKFLGMENIWGGISQYIKDFFLTEDFKVKSSIGKEETPMVRDIQLNPQDQSIRSVQGDSSHTFISTNKEHASEGTFFVDRIFMDGSEKSRLGIYNLDVTRAMPEELWKTSYIPNTSLGVFSTIFLPMNMADVNSNIGCRCSVLGRR